MPSKGIVHSKHKQMHQYTVVKVCILTRFIRQSSSPNSAGRRYRCGLPTGRPCNGDSLLITKT
ncbi:hypothetical protein BX666DRAFT_882232 [Dichotomocladium elegans]|nr:hypothetical protein BX666DRAFT_882232 [Dichotomocladium elegans]